MSLQFSQVPAESELQSWLGIEELKRLALSRGCPPGEFARAAEMMGSHPLRVARYLKRHSFVPRNFEIPQGGHFQVGVAAQGMTA